MILQPLSFASIGIILWIVVLYTVSTVFAKVVCGLWLVRISIAPGKQGINSLLAELGLPSTLHL
jgi:hypothetical protein